MLNQLTQLPFPPPCGVRGSKGRGLSYERKVEKWLARSANSFGATLHSHPWLAAPDGGVCQPDFVLEFASGAYILIEAKLTQVDCSAQLEKYKSALLPAKGIVVQLCRRLTTTPTIRALEDASGNDTMLLWV